MSSFALDPASGRRVGPRGRSLALFFTLSIAAHAVVFGLLPQFARDSAPPLLTLEVTVEKAKPLPVSPPEPEPPPPPPQRKPEPQRRPDMPTRARTPATPQPEQQAPILALPSTQAPAENAFTVPAQKPAETPRAPEPQAASVPVTPPVFNAAYLRNPAPQYPLAARRAGAQGTTTLRVLVTPEGVPARVDLEKSSGSTQLDHAALEAVKGWRFTPARRGNEPVEGWVLVPIVFRLEG